MTLDDKLRKGTMTRRDFNKLLGQGVLVAVAGGAVATNEKCSSSDPDPPPPPPTKYKHALKATVERTLHYGVPVTAGTYDVTMLSNGKQFLNNNLGTVVNLDETTNREERCNVIVRVPGCLPSEFRNLAITNNDLAVKDVAHLGDFDLSYLLSDVLTHKVNGKSKNTSWVNQTMAGSANEYQGLRLDQAYIDSIVQALTEFVNAGRRYKGTALEEAYIKTFTFNPNGNNPLDSSVPPNGEFWAFHRTDISGVANITYPTSFVNVASSKMFVNQSSAIPGAAYREAFDALLGDGQEIGDDVRFLACVPLLMWRPRDANDYWVDSEKESREGVDSFSGTILNAYAQEYVVLEKGYANPISPISNDFINNPGIGKGGIDYTVPVGEPHFARGMPLRPSEGPTRGNARGEIRK